MKSRIQISVMSMVLGAVIALMMVEFHAGNSQSPANATGINASNIYNDKIMVAGNNIKNIIILLPNEAHESPTMPEEQRLINQPYVPENLQVSPGTSIIWFNGDVGHDHEVTVVDENSNEVFSDEFDFNTSTEPLSLNETGKFTYSESDVNTEDPDFIMEGTVTVNDATASNIDSNGGNATFDTVGLLMVPAKDLDEHISTLDTGGINILDQFTFKDLRGGQKGTGPEQTLLVLGSRDGPSQLISTMESISPTLPYS